ncbi:MAG: chemotaxis protein CheX [Phycisphaerales bacterium]|nr:chemotaxis protein CheX [Phycisphaerales bacterium]
MSANTQASEAQLTRVLDDVLGGLAFLIRDDETALPEGQSWWQCLGSYSGDASGVVRCSCSRGFAAMLAQNLLGAEAGEAVDDETATDALREFMNVLCGNLVTSIHGSTGVFDIGIPQVTELESAPSEATMEPIRARFSIEGEPVICEYIPG